MALPGLQLSAPVQTIAPSLHDLAAGTEWRFEVAHGTTITLKVLRGYAEIFGTELAPLQTYTFTGTKAAVYSWRGCQLSVTGRCAVEYQAEETPMVSYANTHFALENMRAASLHSGRPGPRVLAIGPVNAGKTALVKLLTAYATKEGRMPVVVNLDPQEGLLSVPGSLTATVFSSVVDVEDGWGSADTSGPLPVPGKMPLVYYYPAGSPEENAKYYKPVVARLALALTSRLADDAEVRAAGCLIDTPGVISQGKGSYEMIQHIVSEFAVNVILVLGSERLYSDMVRRFDKKSTSTDESISVVKLDKSGGCVDRDDSYMSAVRSASIREYYFGDAKSTLSPHTQQVDFSQLSIFKVHSGQSVHTSLLPGGFEDSTGPPPVFEKVEPTPLMQNAVLALMFASIKDSHEEIRDAAVMGFVYVADVDEKRRKVKILCPVTGRLPERPLIWGVWPEGPSNLVS
ncbi:MAG: Cleavage polyadenylation factor subunit clp1 [Vezdaea aestivalis]|nr:MAG: Cleavage polyadenylation factor subunit clp1 [Vezdaea aestivalis]